MDNQHREIKGYNELDRSTIDKINAVKEKANEVRDLVKTIEESHDLDPRWKELAEVDLQTGFMKLIRSITKPDSY